METTMMVALSRQGALRRQMDIVANNIANMNTSGFKGQKMMFVEHLVKSRGGEQLVGAKLSFVRDLSTMIDLAEGPMEKTGNALDLAIAGEGYFAVQTDRGERYTRNGRFKLDDGGQLVNQSGQPVLSVGGQPFFFGPEDTEIAVSRDGTVATNNGDLGRIRLVTFDNEQTLRRTAGGLFSSEAAPRDVESPDVVQGMLEGSNVQPIFEMARMIEVHRAYDGVKSFIEREDQRMRNMIKELGQAI